MQVTVKVTGPFFDKGSRETVEALSMAVNEVVLTGEALMTQAAQPSPGGVFHSREYAASHGYSQTGHYSRSINGRMVDSLNGVITDSGVVYGPWLEGTSSRNSTTRFKGYAMWRKMRDKLDKLSGGILQKHVKRLIGEID